MTPQEAIELYDPDDAERIVQITARGWFAVPRHVPMWLQDCPQLCEPTPLFASGDPCD